MRKLISASCSYFKIEARICGRRFKNSMGSTPLYYGISQGKVIVTIRYHRALIPYLTMP